MNLKNKNIIVFDYGNFIHSAERLSRDFGNVYYYTPFQTSFPKYHNQIIGQGLPGIHRIYDFWRHLPMADMVFFPDLFQGDLQCYLREQGVPVCGAFMAEELEIFRPEFKQVLKDVGLPVGSYEVVYGMDNLRAYLTVNSDRYIKMNGYLRGQMETWHHEDYDLSKPILDMMEHALGPSKNLEPFVVEEPVECESEEGYDGMVVDGKFPDKTLYGFEIKNESYCGVVVPYKNLPESVRLCNQKMSETFEQYGYRGFYSNEIRTTKDNVPYFTDPTCRLPSPPSEVQCELYDNYGELVWDMANGKVPEIKTSCKYGAEVIIKSGWASTEPQAIYFPEEIARWVKIKNHAVIDGVNYFIPQQDDMEEIGALCFCSNSLSDLRVEIEYMAKKVKGYEISIDTDSLKEAIEKVEKYENA